MDVWGSRCFWRSNKNNKKSRDIKPIVSNQTWDLGRLFLQSKHQMIFRQLFFLGGALPLIAIPPQRHGRAGPDMTGGWQIVITAVSLLNTLLTNSVIYSQCNKGQTFRSFPLLKVELLVGYTITLKTPGSTQRGSRRFWGYVKRRSLCLAISVVFAPEAHSVASSL